MEKQTPYMGQTETTLSAEQEELLRREAFAHYDKLEEPAEVLGSMALNFIITGGLLGAVSAPNQSNLEVGELDQTMNALVNTANLTGNASNKQSNTTNLNQLRPKK